MECSWNIAECHLVLQQCNANEMGEMFKLPVDPWGIPMMIADVSSVNVFFSPGNEENSGLAFVHFFGKRGAVDCGVPF